VFRKLYKLTKFFSGGAGGELKAAPLSVAEEGKNKVSTFQVRNDMEYGVEQAGRIPLLT
jgi:hypothetical protein